jgi:hypothetical protein
MGDTPYRRGNGGRAASLARDRVRRVRGPFAPYATVKASRPLRELRGDSTFPHHFQVRERCAHGRPETDPPVHFCAAHQPTPLNLYTPVGEVLAPLRRRPWGDLYRPRLATSTIIAAASFCRSAPSNVQRGFVACCVSAHHRSLGRLRHGLGNLGRQVGIDRRPSNTTTASPSHHLAGASREACQEKERGDSSSSQHPSHRFPP